MKKITVLMILCGAAGLLSSCSQEPEPEAVALEHPQVCKLENDKKRVTTEGFIELGAASFCSGANDEPTCGLRVKENLGDDKFIAAFVYVGAGANRMDELTDHFTPDDLKLRADDNSAVSPQEKVRITGDVGTSAGSAPGEITCYIRIKKIEKRK